MNSRKLCERLISSLITERKKAGLTQMELGKRLKKSQTWVARVESGKRMPTVIEFISVANCIGFDPIKIMRLLRD